jgi:hypothetical protein
MFERVMVGSKGDLDFRLKLPVSEAKNTVIMLRIGTY